MGGSPDRVDGFGAWDADTGSVVIGTDSWGVLQMGRASCSEPNRKQVRTDSNADRLDLALGMDCDTGLP